ncbi:MAG: SDR family oxidoreductase [Methylotenera sp.]|uniref:UDP-glucose 4-epimerase family protein n=1 Tax=Methylotenera sp. TaxID=2051956 RepID=UPI002715B6F5|nr:SDR family oxidoreductase [Methylotenera sp.]MDO9150502.1 SDR family oxidoreductase [Methylotenera sp.]
MKLLITGATGFVGGSLIGAIQNTNHQVCSAVRRISANSQQADVVSVGDINANTNWQHALTGVDVVIHLAARVHVMHEFEADPLTEFRQVNVQGTLNLARQAVKTGVKRFIFVSSIKVNGEQTQLGQPFTALDTPSPQDAYGISKYEAEQGLLALAKETGLEVVIIRPPLIYGAGVKANFASMMRIVQRGIPLPFGAIDNKRSLVYVGNLVSLMIKCIDHPAAVNRVFLVSDGHDISTTELLQACAVALGVKPRLLPVPQKMIEVGAALVGKKAVAQRLCGNLQVDIEHTRRLLGWEPPVTVAEGLNAVALNLS